MIKTVTIRFLNKSGEIVLPRNTNPEHLPLIRSSRAIKTEIASLGEIGIPTTPALASITIESFFWYEDLQRTDELNRNVNALKTPQQYINQFKEWQQSKEPIRFVVDELDYDIWVIFEQFDYDRKAGEEDDIYYKLELLEFRFYSARILEKPIGATSPNQVLPPAPPRTDNKPVVGITHTVQPGENLWSISKKLSNKGGTDWQELYKENIEIIGASPSLLKPGIELRIPQSWWT